MKKIISFFVSVIIILACFNGCSNGETNTGDNNVKDNVSIDDLSSAVLSAVSLDELTKAGESYISLNIDIDLSLCEEYAVYINPTGTADAIGLFKATSEENADKLLTQTKDYVKLLKDTWMTEYLPEETVKLENAVCKKLGKYVIYVILGDTAKDSAVETFEKQLTATAENN